MSTAREYACVHLHCEDSTLPAVQHGGIDLLLAHALVDQQTNSTIVEHIFALRKGANHHSLLEIVTENLPLEHLANAGVTNVLEVITCTFNYSKAPTSSVADALVICTDETLFELNRSLGLSSGFGNSAGRYAWGCSRHRLPIRGLGARGTVFCWSGNRYSIW